jgi:hypothetical protein
MERGKPDQTVYTFEAGPGVTMNYPDAELWTRDYQEARKYASDHGYRVIGNDYEFEDSELVDDFTPAIECQHCGLPVEQVNGTWQDTDYKPGSDEALYCDEAPDHKHAPTQPDHPER